MGNAERVCDVLRSGEDIDVASRRVDELRLCPPTDARKAWDNIAALETITAEVAHDEPVVDLGCRSGILLTWLHQLGYRQLWGCDLRVPYPPLLAAIRNRQWRTTIAGCRMYASHRRRMLRRRVEDTRFPAAHFAAATSLSVIEHGVNVGRFVAEAARLLRPGGLLLVSTDYWPKPIETASLQRFPVAGPDRVLDRAAVNELIAAAGVHGLRIRGAVPDVCEPVIKDSGLSYTFLFLSFRKE